VPQGFDDYSILPGQGDYFNPRFVEKGVKWTEPKLYSGSDADYPNGRVEEGHVTDIITDNCIDWLEQRDEEKPFLLLCHHKAPHDDFEYHYRDEHLFDKMEIPEPGNLREDKSHRSDGSRISGTTVSDRNRRRNAIEVMSRQDYPTGPLTVDELDSRGRTKAAYQKYL